MTNARTRYVLFGGLAILAIGLVAGGTAFLRGGLPSVAQSTPDELRYVPADASLLAYANVRDVMGSEVRDSLRAFRPDLDGQQEFRERTGIDVESDIDSVVASLVSDGESLSGLVLLTGRFNTGRLEEVAQQQGGSVEEYAGHRLLARTVDDGEVAMSFVEPGVLALGSVRMVRRAIDQVTDETASDVTANERLMGLMTHVRETDNAWAVARFESPGALPYLPDEVVSQMPPIVAMAVGGRFDAGVNATLTVEASDEQSGQDLQAVVQGFVALARMQVRSRPVLQGLLDSVQLRRTGNVVTLTLEVAPEIFESTEPTSQDVPQ